MPTQTDRSPQQPEMTPEQRRRLLALLLLIGAGGEAQTVNGKIQGGRSANPASAENR